MAACGQQGISPCCGLLLISIRLSRKWDTRGRWHETR